MVTLENQQLKVSLKAKGAELDSLFLKDTNTEYLWNGDPKFWSKKSPLLFPIVGALKQNTYYYNNKPYHLPRHGFARDTEFALSDHTDISATFSLSESAETLANYPFPFKLDVLYSIKATTLYVTYKVSNTGTDNMYFSIGAHPAFRLPLEEKLNYDDYYFEFEQIEDGYRWLISSEGLIEPTTVPFLINTNVLPITKELFRKDAIVFKYLNSTRVSLKSNRSKHGVEVNYPGFPFIGLWAAPDADFVCIEPWCGIADATTSNQKFINKEGINLLTPTQVFERTWSVRVF